MTEFALQPVWDLVLAHRDVTSQAWFDGLLPFVVLVVYGGVFLLADNIGCWDRYRLQPRERPNDEAQWRYALNTMFVYAAVVIPANTAATLLAPPKDLPDLPPTLFTFAWEVMMLLVAMDTGYFLWHYAHHQNKWLFRTFHALHHEATATNVWVAQHLTIAEFLVVAGLSTVPAIVIGAHPLSAWVWYALSVTLSIDGHCGYDLPFHPFAPLVWAGVLGGSRHHDLHHLRPHRNMAPFLTFWDRIAGTHSEGKDLSPDQFLFGERERAPKASKAE